MNNNNNNYSPYCPQTIISVPRTDDYPVDVQSGVPPEVRSFNPNTAVPPPVPNGGLYGGPQSTSPWASIPVAPTTTNLIHNNMRSANPPPGATEHYPGNNRTGNNYTPMPGISWLNAGGSNFNGKYRLKTTK